MPDTDPAARLRRILDIYRQSPDGRVVLEALDGRLREDESLTLGDLRDIAQLIGA